MHESLIARKCDLARVGEVAVEKDSDLVLETLREMRLGLSFNGKFRIQNAKPLPSKKSGGIHKNPARHLFIEPTEVRLILNFGSGCLSSTNAPTLGHTSAYSTNSNGANSCRLRRQLRNS